MLPLSARTAWKGVWSGDYREACAVKDRLESLVRPWGDVLVLGDEPMRTGVLFRPDGPCLIRWRYAPDEACMIEVALETDVDRLVPVESLMFDVKDEPYAIIDSGDDGGRAEVLEFKPPAGQRLVRTYEIQDDAKQVALLLHRF
ncbi:hypothetical protein COCOR_07134 [Corallococcus coralloides DSM 2259]|uniref:Uncharacterized protein n=2 Tax=Corallococcus coralloides TaxID=184914 RepID=H8MHA1_CORCM|nr:hypothetical protein COCOR_07134 [Corallococcus coralloides DSM 2259]